MSNGQEITHVLSEATAFNLYSNIIGRNERNERTTFVSHMQSQTMKQNSTDSIRSSNEFSNSCRICRWNRSDMELEKCPCLCKGSVGFIHLSCLKRWIMHRRDNHCEICNAFFDTPEDKRRVLCMIKTFVCNCATPILKHTVCSVTLLALSNIILHQVIKCMENINLNSDEALSFQQVSLASGAIISSSALFIKFFVLITTRLQLMGSILRQWWLFGNSSDFALIDMEMDVFDLFT